MKKQLSLSLIAAIVLMGFITIFFVASPNRSSMSGRQDFLDFAPGNDYAAEWLRVDSLRNNGLSQDALKVLNEIYAKASAEDNSPQVAKALLYILSTVQQFEDESVFLNFTRMEEEIQKAKYPLKPVLQSLLAEHYASYYLNNMWKFADRTSTTQVVENDPRTWDLGKIVRTSRELYMASLLDAEQLQRTDVGYFKPVLDTYIGSATYRPTLYDLLAHRALEFLSNDSYQLPSPAYAFELEGRTAFEGDAEFINAKFSSRDTFSHKRLSLLLYQELTRFHMSDPGSSALAYVTLERLAFARAQSTENDKAEWYREGVEKLLARVKGDAVEPEVAYRLAQLWVDESNKYAPLAGDAHKGDKAKALAIVKPYLEGPGSLGHNNCRAIAENILAKELSFTLERIASPNKPFLALATYRNVEKLDFRIVAISEELSQAWPSLEPEKLNDRLLKLKAQQAWSISLPADKDYNGHSVEFPVPALPAGRYALLATFENGFEKTDTDLFNTVFTVSDLAYVSRYLQDGTVEYVLTDRNTGAPMQGVKADVIMQEYDYSKSQYKWSRKESYTSDAQGMLRIGPSTSDYRAYFLEFSFKGQKVMSDDNWYTYRRQPQPEVTTKSTVFFTDRGIYRPGQTVYFKGILLSHTGSKASIRAKANTSVVFYDANSQKIAELNLSSNEFGSIQGSFTAPQGQLNGQMFIANDEGSVYFAVEDYKRPKFEVKMEPVKGSFRLNDKVRVTGKATAYAGSSVDGATVKYRVVRTASYPYCFWSWWRPRPSSPEMEIAHGTAITDPNGAFSIDFQAIPDLKVDPESKPQFNYEVKVDVVDITGETQSASTNASVGYIALAANITAPGIMEVGSENYLALSTKNLNGEFERATGQVKVSKLKVPAVQYRKRLWSMPDKVMIPEQDFSRNFPTTPLRDEDEPKNWAKESTVLDLAFDSEKSDSISLNRLKGWKPGVYKAEMITKDKFGTDVLAEQYFTVFEVPSNTPPTPELLKVKMEQSSYEPGEEAIFTLMVGEDATYVLYEVERKTKNVRREWLKLNKGCHRIKLAVTEEDRGNFAAHFLAIRNGALASETQIIPVPWTNKQLKLDFGTFRSKLWPGQTEEWTMTVSGPKGEKVAAEMLAGMYDASLDAFRSVSWGLNLDPSYFPTQSWSGGAVFSITSSSVFPGRYQTYGTFDAQEFDRFIQVYTTGYYYGGMFAFAEGYATDAVQEGPRGGGKALPKMTRNASLAAPTPAPSPGAPPPPAEQDRMDVVSSLQQGEAEKTVQAGVKNNPAEPAPVQIRTNLNETAFFFPQLRTNEKGDVVISFRIPEALTRWRFMALAHTADLKTGYAERSVVTQKELMVMPNPPRFFRENDEVVFTAKVSNLAETDLAGNASLELMDATTMRPINADLGLSNNLVSFVAKKGQSALVKWKLKIPSGLQAVTYRVVAKAGNYSDGEEAALPVLTNSMLVTEALPLPVRARQTKSFTLDKLMVNKSSTLRNHKLTLEFTSNPAWYAVQALPYMMEYPYECIEQTFSRYYANSIASHVANSHPRIKQVFDAWSQAGGKETLLSNLEKNQELKALLLEETPWVMDAQNETERKKRVALLFDLNRMANELKAAFRKIEQAQVSNGAWPWFPGMPESRFITQHVVAGMGHLDRLGIKSVREDKAAWNMVQKAVGYLDRRLKEDLEQLKKYKADLSKQQIHHDNLHLLYARSYFKDIEVAAGCQEAYTYYLGQAKKYWLGFDRYSQGMISLVLHRSGDATTAKGIIKSLDQNSMKSEELGMYWKDSNWGLYWYQAPIETQALLIEAFDEVTGDKLAVEEMKLWLLKQKQTQDWKTTKATAEACYALLLRGTDLLSQSQIAEITVGGQKIDASTRPDMKTEAGTGYFKTSWSGSEIKPEMGKVTVKNPNEVAAWGALYWQYFEQLDKITFAKTNIQLGKALFLEENTDTGPKLIPMGPGKSFKSGDKVKVRVILTTDRDMEYVHLKDMRASGFEPIDVMSGYRWQDGLGYYQTTRDAATNFFIDYLRKGTYVFEYALRATHQGDFSNGITSIQCMYAPEFTAHSEGSRVVIGE